MTFIIPFRLPIPSKLPIVCWLRRKCWLISQQEKVTRMDTLPVRYLGYEYSSHHFEPYPNHQLLLTLLTVFVCFCQIVWFNHHLVLLLSWCLSQLVLNLTQNPTKVHILNIILSQVSTNPWGSTTKTWSFCVPGHFCSFSTAECRLWRISCVKSDTSQSCFFRFFCWDSNVFIMKP